MPTVDIQVIWGRSLEEKRALVLGITEAIVEALRVPKEIVKITIHEVHDDQVAKGGVLRIDRI